MSLNKVAIAIFPRRRISPTILSRGGAELFFSGMCSGFDFFFGLSFLA